MDERKVAIVTGASSGIGQATALTYAQKGYHVLVAARRQDKLAAVAEECVRRARIAGHAVEALPVVTDVAVEAQVQALVARAADTFGRLDVMVNNAGYGLFCRVDETSDAEMRRIFDVNYFGVFYGSKAAAGVMRRQRFGHIFNVSSVIGKRGTPYHGAYCATKFALVGLDDSLRVELLPYKVRVTTVCPALTQTEFFETSRGGRAAKSSFIKFKSMTTADVVARKIVAATGKYKPEIVVTAGGKFLSFISANFPWLADQMMRVYYNDLQKSLQDESDEKNDSI